MMRNMIFRISDQRVASMKLNGPKNQTFGQKASFRTKSVKKNYSLLHSKKQPPTIRNEKIVIHSRCAT